MSEERAGYEAGKALDPEWTGDWETECINLSEEVERLNILLAWRDGELQTERAMFLLGCSEQELQTLYRAAVEAGANL